MPTAHAHGTISHLPFPKPIPLPKGAHSVLSRPTGHSLPFRPDQSHYLLLFCKHSGCPRASACCSFSFRSGGSLPISSYLPSNTRWLSYLKWQSPSAPSPPFLLFHFSSKHFPMCFTARPLPLLLGTALPALCTTCVPVAAAGPTNGMCTVAESQ